MTFFALQERIRTLSAVLVRESRINTVRLAVDPITLESGNRERDASACKHALPTNIVVWANFYNQKKEVVVDSRLLRKFRAFYHSRLAPQFLQNFAPGTFLDPQLGQITACP